MNLKEMLSLEEWQILQLSLCAVFFKIADADGKIDRKETSAIEKFYKNHDSLKMSAIKEVISDNDNFDSLYDMFLNFGKSSKEILSQTSFILDSKLESSDANSFKKHLIALGVYIANASGSFFDYKMSDEEMDALKEIGTYLDISVKDLQQTNIILNIIEKIDK